MHIIGPTQQRGHVLLVAGDVAVRRRSVQVAPSANVAALGVVPVSALLNSGIPSDTTYLDGVRDPNTALTRLRTAAATPGPLLVYLSGRLTVDRRSRRLHLALAGTTAASVRYTALPWEWLGAELGGRPPGLTTVLLDLAADKEAWPLLQEYGSLPAAPSTEVYGVVSPPGFTGGGNVVSSYTRHWIDQLRCSPSRPANLQLHVLAVSAAALPPGALVLPTARELGVPAQDPVAAPGRTADGAPHQTVPVGQQEAVPGPRPVSPAPEAVQDPRPHIHALATSGRHAEAATLAQAWEQHASRAYGFTSPESVQWVEIRADLARMAGDFRLATRLWTGVGRTRLGYQPPDAAEVHAAAAGALYCWTQLKDGAEVREAGTELMDLLRSLPSVDPKYLHLAQQRLELLHRAPSHH
ncbi:hypothetical protein OG429_04485 [Streptomyces sp. NBC_00190]|uniref:hypothetical protein n=1 Tax=unclassified Streptomyces TaxID=2593676 RepID=UPI002E2BD8C8|nr:hypothetical protein [Streptomyces sp. NBC_00190]WSZ38647.1 hypothetical protein OG239_07490 [Streptomyces sp. NBC_00868]